MPLESERFTSDGLLVADQAELWRRRRLNAVCGLLALVAVAAPLGYGFAELLVTVG